jgi:hypothetical protein
MKCDNRLTKGKGMTYWSKELKNTQIILIRQAQRLESFTAPTVSSILKILSKHLHSSKQMLMKTKKNGNKQGLWGR